MRCRSLHWLPCALGLCLLWYLKLCLSSCVGVVGVRTRWPRFFAILCVDQCTESIPLSSLVFGEKGCVVECLGANQKNDGK